MLSSADTLLGDFLVAENSPSQSDINSPMLTAERASPVTSPKYQSNLSLDGGSEISSSGGSGYIICCFFL